MRAASDSEVLTAQVSRPRIFLNRLIFRGMLFTMGTIAVVLHSAVRDKSVTWRFAGRQARNLLRLCGVRVRVRGLEHLGTGPYMFTPNHQSHADIAALLGYLPGINRFGTKKELFREPILGTVLRTMGMIPIDRENPATAIEKLREIGKADFSTIMFPEGTRSHGGQLLPFKKGAFVAAIQLGIPVVPVVCKGTAEVMPKGMYLSILPGDVDLVVLEPVSTVGMVYADRDRLRDLVRERIAAELRK